MERIKPRGEEKAEGEKHAAGVEACMAEALHLVDTLPGQAITMIKTLMMASRTIFLTHPSTAQFHTAETFLSVLNDFSRLPQHPP